MKQKLLPALAGGALGGVLAGIPIIGWFWFFWAIGGAVLAMFLYRRKAGPAIEISDGAIVGGIAGLVTGILNIIAVVAYAAIWAAIIAFSSPGSTEDRAAAFGVQFGISMIGVIFNIVFSVFMVILAVLTGVLFVAIAKSNSKPVQPTAFGTPGSYQ